MRRVQLPRIGTVAAWRREARNLAAEGVPPEAILWHVGDQSADLFMASPPGPTGTATTLTLPRDAVASIEKALCHSDPERFARAYGLVLRLSRRDLRWGDRSDPALYRLLAQEKAVRRDIHKMHAFVRFREISPPDAPRRAFAAWFEPDHPIVEAATPFFAKRFGDMDWVIATPTLTARFEDGTLSYHETQNRTPPPDDATEALWRTYFAHIFNPARLMVSAMTSEMPRKYWKNLPEADLIPDMIRTAPARARAMQDAAPTLPLDHIARLRLDRPALPETDGLTFGTLKPALDACRRCPIGYCATQAVAGEGPAGARLMIVGEQPGDAEDLSGRPFVGPAGQVFDRCTAAAGLDRRAAYVTNAVKHFKYESRGKVRLHQRPNGHEVAHCRWWLTQEIDLVKPTLIVAMGSTAALALTGSDAGITTRRGKIEEGADGIPILITYHPSYILRLRQGDEAAAAKAQLTDDLRLAVGYLARLA